MDNSENDKAAKIEKLTSSKPKKKTGKRISKDIPICSHLKELNIKGKPEIENLLINNQESISYNNINILKSDLPNISPIEKRNYTKTPSGKSVQEKKYYTNSRNVDVFNYNFADSDKYKTTFADIETDANRLLNPTKDDYSILYTFKNAKKNETRVPYEGEVLRISSFVFRLKNYSTTINNHDLRLKITYDGQIYRASYGEGDCEIKKTIEHRYIVKKHSISVEQNTDEQQFSYDITNNKKLMDLSDSH